MNKLKEIFKGIKEKWAGLSKKRKIAFSVLAIGIITSMVILGVYFARPKYAVLFSKMDPNDSGAVLQKLKDKKIEAKVEGGNILVPKNQVDELRMQLAAEVPMTNGSQGFELLDKSKFGQTDKEMEINYQRALQGELERTIKTFPQVENARVHLVLPEDTDFVKDVNPGRASVTLNIKKGQKLDKDQVKAIVGLISGSVKGIPKENVEVLDNKMTLLTKNLFTEEGSVEQATTSAEKQQLLQQKYERDLQKRLLAMLEDIYGKDKVKVNVTTELDFDAVKTDSVNYDPKNVVVSEHNIKEQNKNTPTSGNKSENGSAVDNNMVNSTTTEQSSNQQSSREETTKNYEISKTEQKTIKSPGSVKRLTASVALDGNIDEATRTAVRNLAVSAIGFDQNRGDTISIEGIPFDTEAKDRVKKDLDQMQKSEKTKNMIGLGAIGAVALAAIIGIIVALRKRRLKDEEEDDETTGIDVLIDDDNIENKDVVKPINLEEENPKKQLENEIKKYAKEKPEQVAEIVKSWLAEDER